MQHRNLYARNGNVYSGENYDILNRAANGRLVFWLTKNQVENVKGKYLFRGLCLTHNAVPVSIKKAERETGEMLITKVYNIEDTNFKIRYPRVYAYLKKGMTTEQAIETTLSEPLDSWLDRILK